MIDREICEKIIDQNGHCKHPLTLVECWSCPLKSENCCMDLVLKVRLAKQWLKDHTEKYTYAEVDLPEWWDGRPIKGCFWDNGKENKEVGYCDCIDTGINDDGYPYRNSSDLMYYKNFEPLTESPTTAKVSITKDGETKEIELTPEQIEALGI